MNINNLTLYRHDLKLFFTYQNYTDIAVLEYMRLIYVKKKDFEFNHFYGDTKYIIEI